MNKQTQKSQNIRPFRIKLSSIVSIRCKRYEPNKDRKILCQDQPKQKNGKQKQPTRILKRSRNNINKKTAWYWLDPIPNEDDSIALIGRRIKCILPKILLEGKQNFIGSDDGNANSGNIGNTYTRVFEGEVISILDRQSSHLKVSILVDDNIIQQLPIQNEGEKDSTISNVEALSPRHYNGETDKYPLEIVHVPNVKENENLSNKKRQMRMYEERIRGAQKSMIQLFLPIPKSSNPSKSKNQIRWAVRKPVYSGSDIPAGGGYVGDGNDKEGQQEKNFRWLSNRRTGDWYQDHCRVGEVIRVIPTNTAINGNGKGAPTTLAGLGSLAKVVIRPLKYVEETMTGRMDHHFWNELCDLDLSNESYTNFSTSGTIEVPIEDLVVIAKKANRKEDPIRNKKSNKTQQVTEIESKSDNEVIIRYKYNEELGLFEPLIRTGLQRMCHRCRSLDQEIRMGQCQSKHCSDGEINHSDDNGGTVDDANGGEGGKWWCKQCIKVLRKRRKFVLRKDCHFYGPCCLGQCDCNECIKNSRIVEGKSLEKIMVSCCQRFPGTCDLSSSSKVVPTNQGSRNSMSICIGCMRKCCKYGTNCAKCSRLMHQQCQDWEQDLWKEKNTNRGFQSPSNQSTTGNTHENGANTLINSKCYQCQSFDNKKNKSACTASGEGGVEKNTLFQLTANVLEFIPPMEFSLPFDIARNLPKPKCKPHEHSNGQRKRPKLNAPKKKNVAKSRNVPMQEAPDSTPNDIDGIGKDSPQEEEVFKPTSARIVLYDPSTKMMRSSNNSAAHAARSLASMRTGGRKSASRNTRGSTDDKKSNGRAARANQRRMLKDSWMRGGVKETLTGCEHALRFGKSIIHGWGVFTDEEITAGDLIVEYR